MPAMAMTPTAAPTAAPTTDPLLDDVSAFGGRLLTGGCVGSGAGLEGTVVNGVGGVGSDVGSEVGEAMLEGASEGKKVTGASDGGEVTGACVVGADGLEVAFVVTNL